MSVQVAVCGWQEFFERVTSFLRGVESVTPSQRHIEHCLEHLQLAYSGIVRIRDLLRGSNFIQERGSTVQYYESLLNELLSCLSEVYSDLEGQFDQVVSIPNTSYLPSIVQGGGRGRPKFDIKADQLEYLRSLSFSWTEISAMLGISRMTLYRRRIEYGMLRDGRSIDYDELLVLLREMRVDFPDMGEIMVRGRLRALGFNVTHQKIRNAIRETDPINSALKATTGPVIRRTYNVAGPNSLWHIGMLWFIFIWCNNVEALFRRTIMYFITTRKTIIFHFHHFIINRLHKRRRGPLHPWKLFHKSFLDTFPTHRPTKRDFLDTAISV